MTHNILHYNRHERRWEIVSLHRGGLILLDGFYTRDEAVYVAGWNHISLSEVY